MSPRSQSQSEGVKLSAKVFRHEMQLIEDGATDVRGRCHPTPRCSGELAELTRAGGGSAGCCSRLLPEVLSVPASEPGAC